MPSFWERLSGVSECRVILCRAGLRLRLRVKLRLRVGLRLRLTRLRFSGGSCREVLAGRGDLGLAMECEPSRSLRGDGGARELLGGVPRERAGDGCLRRGGEGERRPGERRRSRYVV